MEYQDKAIEEKNDKLRNMKLTFEKMSVELEEKNIQIRDHVRCEVRYIFAVTHLRIKSGKQNPIKQTQKSLNKSKSF